MNRICKFTWGITLLLKALPACACLGEEIVLQDGTFNDADWSQATVGLGGLGTGSQVDTGGNPDAYRAATISGPGSGDPEFASINIYKYVFNPVNGAIVSIDYSQDFRVISNNQPVPLLFGIALMQAGKYFTGPAFTTSNTSWSTANVSSLHAADFVDRLEYPPGHLYLNAGSLPISFGFYVEEFSHPIGFQSVSGIDNWQVTLHVDVPGPGAGNIASPVVLALVLGRRRLRGAD